MTDNCPIRSTRDGSRCDRCRAVWDRDDTAPPCPRQVAERAAGEDLAASNRYMAELAKGGFVSGLPPRRW